MFSCLQFLIIVFSFFLSIIVVSVVDGYQKQAVTLDQSFPLQVTVGADGSKMFISEIEVEQIKKIDGVTDICTEYSGADLYAYVDGKKTKTVIYSDELMRKIGVHKKERNNCAIYIGTLKSNTAILHASSEFTKQCEGLMEDLCFRRYKSFG